MRGFPWMIAAIALAGSLPASAAAPSDPATIRFDRSIASTKQAMMGDPKRALASAEASLSLARKVPGARARTIATATAEWLEAEALIGINAPARAVPIVDEAIKSVAATAPNTKLHGDLMRSRGALAAMSGRAQEALQNYQAAHGIFRRAGEQRSQAIALQDIGKIYRDAGDFERVLRYYDQSQEAFSADPFLKLTTHNNRAEVLREMKRFPQAIAEYSEALTIARAIKSPLLETRILTNLAAAQIDAGELTKADRTIATATRLARSGEAQGWQTFVLGVTAELASARGNPARAATLLEQMFAGMDLSTTPMPFREFHQIGAQVYERLGRSEDALRHLKAFQRLDAEARELVASTNAQLMAAQFDYTNQNLKISKLTEGQLKRDVVLARQRSLIFQGLLAVGGVALATLAFWLWQSRRSRNRLAASNKALEKALAAKTEFLATTSHEIRTPLNGILGMTQVLLADGRIDAGVREKVEIVHGAGEAMKALVDDLLDVAKMETGEIAIVEEDTDLSAILLEAGKMWNAQAELKQLSLTVDETLAPRWIVTDAQRLRQIVFNLMSNATKFTLDGSVTMIAEARESELGEELIIVVRDTGIGIAPDQHELIFEPFRQVEGGTDRRFSGTGLGLSICRKLAAALGGTITVESALGEGASFTVRLPLQRVARDSHARVPATNLTGASVLVVDRNMLNQAILRGLLAPLTAAVTTAGKLQEAARIIVSESIDHLLIDSSVASGEDAMAELRDIVTLARQAEARITLLYTPDGTFDIAAVAAIGADQAVAKPIDGSAIAKTMAELYSPLAPTVIAAKTIAA